MKSPLSHRIPPIVVYVLLIAISLTFISLGIIKANTHPKTHFITLTKNGFKPADRTIQAGDTIVFKNTTGSAFWPASNLHPTHTIYSEFDPKQPVPAPDSWAFTFTKTGIWQYHDHLSPYFTGTITVKAGSKQQAATGCQDLADIRCLRETVIATFKSQGVAPAADQIESFANQNANFSQTCHTLAHEIGKAAYELYQKNQSFNVTPKASFCAFGFYHGFMEALLQDTNDLSKARDFCHLIDAQLAKDNPDVGLQCFHGIGHGTVGSHDPLLWGNEEAMVEPALKLCREVSADNSQLYRCASGVFNGIANFYMNHEYDLSLNTSDPLWLCAKQPSEFQEPCYGNMNVAILWANQNDFSQAAPFFFDLPLPLTQASIRYLAAHNALINLNQNHFSQNLAQCHALPKDLSIECIKGYVGGLIEHGSRTNGYIAALDFCHQEGVNQSESSACVDHALTYMKNWYSSQIMTEICQLAAVPTHPACK